MVRTKGTCRWAWVVAAAVAGLWAETAWALVVPSKAAVAVAKPSADDRGGVLRQPTDRAAPELPPAPAAAPPTETPLETPVEPPLGFAGKSGVAPSETPETGHVVPV